MAGRKRLLLGDELAPEPLGVLIRLNTARDEHQSGHTFGVELGEGSRCLPSLLDDAVVACAKLPHPVGEADIHRTLGCHRHTCRSTARRN